MILSTFLHANTERLVGHPCHRYLYIRMNSVTTLKIEIKIIRQKREKVEIFTSVQAFRYIMCVCKFFLSKYLFFLVKWSRWNCRYYVDIINYIYSDLSDSTILCITHKCNFGIDWKFVNKKDYVAYIAYGLYQKA